MKTGDTQKIESSGVNYLEECINKSEYLHAYFKKNDKYPLWDGDVLVYESSPISNSNFTGRIPVQIKTTTVKKNDTDYQKISIKRKYLCSYYNDGGVMYFFICINNDRHIIYYQALTQLRINEYLKYNDNMKISIELKKFPEDNIASFTNLLIEFFNEIKFKPSTSTLSLGDLKKIRAVGFDEISIGVSTLGYKNVFDRIFDQPVYVHAVNTIAGIEIPLGESIIRSIIREHTDCPIKINNKIYYNSFTFSNGKKEIIFNFGKNIQLSCLKTDNISIESNIKFNLAGTLDERITDLGFLISLMKYKVFFIGNNECSLPISENEWDNSNPNFNINTMNEHFEYYINVKETFDILNIKKQLDFTTFDELSNINLRFLIAGIKNNLPQDIYNYNGLGAIKDLKISNILVRTVITKQVGSKYIINDFFNANLTGFYPSRFDENISIHTSPYMFMDIDDFTRISNINYEHIYDSFIRLPDNDELFQMTMRFISDMLSAYDILDPKDKNDELLSCSLKLTEWLLGKCTTFKNYLIIDKLQILRRTRKLTNEEESLLFEIITTEKENSILVEAYILLENSIMAIKYYEKLDSSERKEFDKYPINIFRMFDKNTEDISQK